VNVINPATNPAKTSSVDDPGRVAYQAFHQFTATECNLPFQCVSALPIPLVPAGKRLVVEHIVISAALNSGTLVRARIIVGSVTGGPFVLGSFFFVPTKSAPGFGTAATGDQSVRFYVDGGNSFQAVLQTDGTFVNDPGFGGPVVEMSVTGYLLDCTVNSCAPIAP
jgi:hypothetical protein